MLLDPVALPQGSRYTISNKKYFKARFLTQSGILLGEIILGILAILARESTFILKS